MTNMDVEKPAPAVKPIGPTEALERATSAARSSDWEASAAWSALGMLAIAVRSTREVGRGERRGGDNRG